MKVFNSNRALVVTLSLISCLAAYLLQRNEFLIIFTLAVSLLMKKMETIKIKESVYTVGLIVAIGIFPYYPIWAFIVFEFSRLINKGFENLNEGIFSIVPLATLLLCFNEFTALDNTLFKLCYFSFSGLVIFKDKLKENGDWPSLVAFLYFLRESNLSFNDNSTILLIFICFGYLALNKFFYKKPNFFELISLSSIGLISVTVPTNKLYAFIVVSLLYIVLNSTKKIGTELLSALYIFTLFFFSKNYFNEASSWEGYFPIIFLLLPILSLSRAENVIKGFPKSTHWKLGSAISLIAYGLGVLAYVN